MWLWNQVYSLIFELSRNQNSIIMTKLTKTTLFSAICLLVSLSNNLFAQCGTTYAGTMLQGATSFCLASNNPLPTSHTWTSINNVYQNDPLLDANDTLLFYFTDIDGPINGEIIGSAGAEQNIPLPAGSIEVGVPYRLYAMAGNKDGNGGIDTTDVCLSISQSWGISYNYENLEIWQMDVTEEITCEGELLLDAGQFILNGAPEQFFYNWSTGEIGPQIIVVEPGIYFVDIFGEDFQCPVTNIFEVLPYTPITFSFDPVDSISCEATDTSLIRAIPSDPLGSWSGRWFDLQNNVIAFDVLEVSVNIPGIYTFEITRFEGNDAICIDSYDVLVPASTEGCVLIEGSVVRDQDDDCAYDMGEPGLPNRILSFDSPVTTRYALTDANGNYELYYPANTDATASIVSAHFLYENCEASWMVNGAGVGETITSSVAQTTIDDCPLLDVQLHAGITRRCFSVPFDVSYCNSGNLPAEDAYVIVTLDEHFLLDSSELAFIDLGNNQYRFDLGTVVEDECNDFRIYTTLSCNSALGETLCSEAHIFPDTPCPGPAANWSEASVFVSGTCDGIENKFIIANIGTQDMLDVSNYIVIEDGIMVQTPSDFILNSGDSNEITYPANGKTYRVEAMQVPNHPGMSMPSFTIEGCGGFGSTGFVNQFAQDDLDPSIDIECREAIGSYDPNDKTAFPSGYSDEHFIKADQQLEYLIRFQNTGTDTAFTVMIQDVLDPNLDLTSFQPQRASHDYEVIFLENDTIQFVFNNILLPDSTTNQVESNGYIRFKIYPEADIALGTVLKNEAAIFFDFNEPIITNEVFHTIGDDFVLTNTNFISTIKPEVITYPNPTSGEWFLSIKNVEDYGDLNLVLTDALGRSVIEKVVGDEGVRVDIFAFSNGVYFWKLETENEVVGSGRLMRM